MYTFFFEKRGVIFKGDELCISSESNFFFIKLEISTLDPTYKECGCSESIDAILNDLQRSISFQWICIFLLVVNRMQCCTFVFSSKEPMNDILLLVRISERINFISWR